MKRVFSIILVFIIFIGLLTGCGSKEEHVGQAKTPSGSIIQQGRDYQRVVHNFEERGFTNIKLNAIDDLVTGLITKDGEVEYVSVNGDIDYEPDKWYPEDTEVIISYHTFPIEETNEALNDIKAIDTSDKNDMADDTEVSDVSVNSESSDPDILTTDNCPDLASLLATQGSWDPAYADFAKTYRGKIIEFNGSIDYKENTIVINPFTGEGKVSEYGYDVLLSSGDYDPNTQFGPTFKMEDLRSPDVGGDAISKSLPDFMTVGSNVRIRAKVGSYDSDSDIITLICQSITPR